MGAGGGTFKITAGTGNTGVVVTGFTSGLSGSTPTTFGSISPTPSKIKNKTVVSVITYNNAGTILYQVVVSGTTVYNLFSKITFLGQTFSATPGSFNGVNTWNFNGNNTAFVATQTYPISWQ